MVVTITPGNDFVIVRILLDDIFGIAGEGGRGDPFTEHVYMKDLLMFTTIGHVNLVIDFYNLSGDDIQPLPFC